MSYSSRDGRDFESPSPAGHSCREGHQEFSSRALVTVVPIMFLLLGPLLLILVCVGYRVFVRTKQAQAKKRPSLPQSRDGGELLLQTRPPENDGADDRSAISEEHHQRETEIN